MYDSSTGAPEQRYSVPNNTIFIELETNGLVALAGFYVRVSVGKSESVILFDNLQPFVHVHAVTESRNHAITHFYPNEVGFVTSGGVSPLSLPNIH